MYQVKKFSTFLQKHNGFWKNAIKKGFFRTKIGPSCQLISVKENIIWWSQNAAGLCNTHAETLSAHLEWAGLSLRRGEMAFHPVTDKKGIWNLSILKNR